MEEQIKVALCGGDASRSERTELHASVALQLNRQTPLREFLRALRLISQF